MCWLPFSYSTVFRAISLVLLYFSQCQNFLKWNRHFKQFTQGILLRGGKIYSKWDFSDATIPAYSLRDSSVGIQYIRDPSLFKQCVSEILYSNEPCGVLIISSKMRMKTIVFSNDLYVPSNIPQ